MRELLKIDGYIFSDELSENRFNIVFNLFAKTDAFKFGLSNGLYL